MKQVRQQLSLPSATSAPRTGHVRPSRKRRAHPDVDTTSEVRAERIRALALAAIEQRGSDVAGMLDDAHRGGLGWWAVCTRLVAPAARLTGEWWREDGCTFLEVTLATSELHRASRSLIHDDMTPARSHRGRILLSAAPGAQHTLGMLLAGERLVRRGWEVEMGWPFQSPEPALSTHLDVVGLSLSGPRDFEWARQWSADVRDRGRDSMVLFGGNGAPEFEECSGIRSGGRARGTVLAALEPAS